MARTSVSFGHIGFEYGPPMGEECPAMAGKPKAPVPERRLAVKRPVSLDSAAGKHGGANSLTKLWLGQAPKR